MKSLTPDKTDQTSVPKPDTPMWVLIPHATLESFVTVSAEVNADPEVQKAGAEYLQAPKSAPAFDRIDSWLRSSADNSAFSKYASSVAVGAPRFRR